MCLEKSHLFYSAHFENPHFASGDQRVLLNLVIFKSNSDSNSNMTWNHFRL